MKKTISMALSFCLALNLLIIAIPVNALNQPSAYPFPITFDEGYTPFSLQYINSTDTGYTIVNDSISYPTETSFSGSKYAHFNIQQGTIRTDSNTVTMAGISGFSKTDFSDVTGIMMRIRINEDASNTASHPFSLYCTQSGISNATYLAKNAVFYNIDGTTCSSGTSGDLSASIPANFNGFIFLPFNNARSGSVTIAGSYDNYQTYPGKLVNFANQYTMQLKFSDSSWMGKSVDIDDMYTYSGKDYVHSIISCGYKFQQPSAYNYPIIFDEGYTPFSMEYINSTETGYEIVDDSITYPTDTSFSGSTYAHFNIQQGTIRTDSNTVNMAGITGFNKAYFSTVTGIMMRIKINESASNTTPHSFYLYCNQSGVSKATHLARNAVLYNADGTVCSSGTGGSMSTTIPARFDGFIFLPFADAQSENVTIPGSYDNFNVYPENLVNFANPYTMQLKFNDASWTGTSVDIDSMNVYSGSDYVKSIVSCGYKFQQPSAYPLPVNFDEGYTPFSLQYINSTSNGYTIVNDSITYPVDESNSLSGGSYAHFNIQQGTIRTDTNTVNMAGIAGFSKTDFSKVTGIMLRIRINEAAGNTTAHKFLIYCNQSGVSRATYLANSAVFYNADGTVCSSGTSSNLSSSIPANFNGYIFFPFASARSETVTTPGYYDNYQTYPNSMVNFANPYSLQFKFNDASLIGNSVDIDSISVYSGTDYVDAINSYGYKFQQPSAYKLPITFDEGYTPFALQEINSATCGSGYTITDGTVNYVTDGALNGTTSVQFPISNADIRAETKNTAMAGISGFSKTNFSSITGIMMRIKIVENSSNTTAHNLRLFFSQSGVEKNTILCNGASAYDLNGNQVSVVSNAEQLLLPASFNGYIFLPFNQAHSEKVTTPGSYDMYSTYPQSMVDFSNNFSMSIKFADASWQNKMVYMDDIYVYSGTDNVSSLNSIINPTYSLPLNLDGGKKPFVGKLNAATDAASGKYFTGGTLSYTTNALHQGGTAIKMQVPNVIGKQSVYTSTAMIQNTNMSSYTGIVMRIKTNARKSASVYISMDKSSGGPDLGYESKLFDTTGTEVDHPRDNAMWYGCSLPNSFDGYIFIPLSGAIFGGSSRLSDHPEWNFNKLMKFAIGIAGDTQISGTTTIIDCVSLYSGTNYTSIIQSLGYTLSASTQTADFDVVGNATQKFLFNPVFNDDFNGSISDLSAKWNIINSADEHSLSGHYSTNVSLDSGSLKLSLKNESRNGQAYTAGAVKMQSPCSYGYYEAKIKFPNAINTYNAMKLVTQDHYSVGGSSFEVDTACNQSYGLTTNLHYTASSGKEISGQRNELPQNAITDDYHIFGILYTYNYIRYYVDGVMVREEVNTFARGSAYLMLSSDVVGDNQSLSGVSMNIDYVRYWSIDDSEMTNYDALPASYTSQTELISGNYGIFLHYLRGKVAPNSSWEQWNATVNSFDVNTFANQAESAGAKWVVLTLTQSDFYFCCPVPKVDSFLNERCGSIRDLPMDLSNALAQKNIKLFLYYVPGPPSSYTELAKAMGATDKVYDNWMLNNWTVVKNCGAVMQELSDRYGDKIAGWWIDGSYDSIGFTDRIADYYAKALKHGNPNSLITFNNGTAYSSTRYTCENYTAGEKNSLVGLSFTSRWSDAKTQNHILTYLGTDWGEGSCKYDNSWFAQTSYNNFLSRGGAMTFDVKITGNGVINDNQLNQLIALKNYQATH